MKQTVSVIVELASVFDPDGGVDVYFLNREPLFHVRTSEELAILFAMAPEGTHSFTTCLALDLIWYILLFFP